MFTACIAEDEYYVQKSIENRIMTVDERLRVVGCASDAVEAEELYNRLHPDVFFVDINMPGKSGLDFMEQIREEDKECRTIFVIISGYSDYQKMHRAIRAGVFDYLQKPIVPSEFADMIGRLVGILLDRDKAGRELPAEKRKASFAEEKDAITKICEYIEEHYAENLNAKSLAEGFFLSTSYITHEFSKRKGVSLGRYLEEVRLKRAEDLIVRTDRSITDIADCVGYTDNNYFTKVFRRKYGISPTDYRKNWQNQQ